MDNAKKLGYESNKEVIIKKYEKIKINNFRGVKDKNIILGDNITLITGKNGTMKSTLLGLIAHPFSSPNDSRDIFGSQLKTNYSDVFKLSIEKDTDEYTYEISLITDKNEHLTEIVRVYPSIKEDRHRVVVGKTNVKGLGNFSLNTCYLNFKRLYPIIDTDASENLISLSQKDDEFIANAYFKIFGTDNFSSHIPVDAKNIKETIGPKDTYYDFKSISSGEDNIGHILIKLLAFKNSIVNTVDLNGIFCIDEIEAGLHPVAQENLLKFLIEFSNKYRVQIVATTHSLSLIQYSLELQEILGKNSISINMVSTAFVADRNFNIINNPNYNDAYKELTFRDINSLENSYKVKIVVEDTVAVKFFNKIFTRNRAVKDRILFITNLVDNESPGNGWKSMQSLMKNGEIYLSDSIIIFDSDVPISSITKTKVAYFQFPDDLNLPLEKRIVYYIYSLPNDHELFKTLGIEKASIINDFGNCNIPLNSLNRDSISTSNVNIFKTWSNSSAKVFNKATEYYIKENKEMFQNFKETIIEAINIKLKEKSLPII
ncbi:MAG: AAA family ATPase [Anaerorhabdus sp.]|uniref:AAA family ATPase n=1 Tax=Anaerorhabdus sp. TaxID=1872524 RepID=UPI003A896DA3